MKEGVEGGDAMMPRFFQLTPEQFERALKAGLIGEAEEIPDEKDDISSGENRDTCGAIEKSAAPESVRPSASVPDFVNTYRSYADVYELPGEVHEANALALLAAVANGNVWIEIGDKRLSLDCWILITTESGGGRNTAIKKARGVLETAELGGVLRNISWGSEAIVKQHFAENPTGLYVWTEMSEKLQDLSKPLFAGVKPWITDLYDETTPPPSKIYRTVPGKLNTPPIEFKVAPRTTFIASSSFEWLIQNLSRLDSTGGFLARWMHIHASGRARRIPIPQPSDKTLVPVLTKRLKEVAQLSGTADVSAIEDMYVEWYEKTADRFEQQPNQDVAQAYWNRHRDHLLKLAVLFEMSSSGTFKVSVESMKRAMAYAKQIEASLFKILPTGFEREGYELARMAEFVRQAGAEGAVWSDFTREFKNTDSGQRVRRLGTLLEGHDLHRFVRQTKGRPAWILVHKDSLEEFKKRYPGDLEDPWAR